MINTLKNFKHKKLFILFIFCWALLTVGTTYAYFAYMEEDTVAIQGNIIAVNAELEVDLVVGTNTEMVPLLDAALSNALNGVGSTNGACIDRVGNLSCQVYKITLINKGSRLEHLTGTVELYPKEGTGNAYSNLKWRELTNPTTIKEDSIINGMEKSPLVTNLTIESKQEMVWYIAVWISEIEDDQKEIDKGDFGGTVTFDFDDSYAEITDELAPNAPVITRVDYNTFQYNATDNVSTTGYYISKDNTTPTEDSDWVTTTTYDISDAGTYSVWARDDVGNISESSSINAYTVTRSAGSGSSLMTRYDSTSEGTGTSFTSNIAVLEGTPIYVKATNNSGYANPTLTSTGATTTNGSYITIGNNVTFSSSAVVGNYSIKNSSGTITDYAVTLADAISKATAGNTISLLRNYTDTSTATFNKNLTLDVPSGLTLTRSTAAILISGSANVTKTGTGTITGSGEHMTFETYNTSVLKLNQGSVNSEVYTAIFTNDDSQVEINGATISASKSASGYWAIRNGSSNTNYAVKLTSGTINSNGGGIYSDTSGVIKMEGGTIITTGNFELHNAGSGSFYIYDGIIGSSSDDAGAVRNTSTGRIDIEGGTITCKNSVCARNDGTGVLRMLHGTLNSVNTPLYNSGTGRIVVGLSGGAYSNAAKVTATGSSQSALYCGLAETGGSRALCTVNAAIITSNDGNAITVNGADYRQYKNSRVESKSSNNSAIRNLSSTFTGTSTCPQHIIDGANISDCFWGRVFVRQGYVQAAEQGIYSVADTKKAVSIGRKDDALFTANTNDVSLGPTIKGSSSSVGYGVYLTNASEFSFRNGIVCGVKSASNKTANSDRDNHKASLVTSGYGSYKCYKLVAN